MARPRTVFGPSETDRLILRLLVKGLTQREVAVKLHYSTSRINARVRYLKRYLNARTDVHVVVLAAAHGLVTLNGVTGDVTEGSYGEQDRSARTA